MFKDQITDGVRLTRFTELTDVYKKSVFNLSPAVNYVCEIMIRQNVSVRSSIKRRKLPASVSSFFFRSHLVYAFMLITDLFVCLCVDALQIIDEEETQFMTNCPPAVTESTPRRRTSIQVFWTAPPSGSGCVFLKYVYSNGWSACLAESSPQLKQ